MCNIDNLQLRRAMCPGRQCWRFTHCRPSGGTRYGDRMVNALRSLRIIHLKSCVVCWETGTFDKGGKFEGGLGPWIYVNPLDWWGCAHGRRGENAGPLCPKPEGTRSTRSLLFFCRSFSEASSSLESKKPLVAFRWH